MSFVSLRSLVATTTAVVIGLAVPQFAGAAPPPGGHAGGSRGNQPELRMVHAFEQHRWFTAEHGAPHPVAVTMLDRSGLLAVADRPGGWTRVTLLDPSSDRVVGRMQVSGLGSAETLADDGHGMLAALSGRKLLTWSADDRGTVRPHASHITGATLGHPTGMAWDAGTGDWLVLDAAHNRLVRLSGRATVSATPGPTLSGLDGVTLRGLGIDPASGRAYVGAPDRHDVYALSGTGGAQVGYTVADAPATTTLAFGPTADPTDDRSITSLYTTSPGTTSGTSPTLGRVSEVSLTPLAAGAATAPQTAKATLVRKTLLSQLSPPSPDPSGIAYMSDQDRLMVVDSEVDEMAIYQGVNMWQISRTGSLLDTGTTYGGAKFSREATGVSYDPVGKRVFISDDDKGKVFQVTTGPDNRYGTSDDAVSSISATAFGDDDAEDVAYDTRDKCLYVTQGVGQEVWRVDPGANGRFDGIAPTGDDQVTHFDTSVYGLTDLEGIGYSPTRDSLFLMDRKYTQVVEVTTAGALVQKIDVSGIGMSNPADITLAPASNDPTQTSMYVVTRGVDNDNHPTENDGTMYELSAPTIGPVNPGTNTAPVVNAGADSTVALPAAAILDGTVTDDGLPKPPGFTTATWTKVSGPGTVNFADPQSVDTTATFSTTGTYVLRLSATDSALTTADDVTITAVSSAPSNTAPSVNAGADQTVNLPASASLQGVVTDDHLPDPPGTTTATWTKVSGPGTVDFVDPGSPVTNALFNEPGTYVLRLTATDSELSAIDDITVIANPAPPTGNLVGNSGFELDTSGWKGSSGTTLSRVSPGHSGSWAGELTNTSRTSGNCTLNDSPDTVSTTVPSDYLATAWVRGDSSAAGNTVRLKIREYAGSTLVGDQESSLTLSTSWQQLVLDYLPNSPGSSHLDVNVLGAAPAIGAMCFQVDDLSVSSTSHPPGNTAPVVDAGPDQAITLPATASLSGTVTDDGQPNPPGATTAHWSVQSGPGSVSFDNPDIKSTTASFSQAGSYVLRLTASDGELSASDDLTVAVADASAPPPPSNLIANSGFEAGTDGWKGNAGTTLARVSPGHTGSWAGGMTNTSGGSLTCQLNDSPDSVKPTSAATYTATAWVRGDAASAGSTVRLRVREWDGQVQAGIAEAAATLTTDWQQITLSYAPAAPGTSSLDLNVVRSATPNGAMCFQVDDLVMTAS